MNQGSKKYFSFLVVGLISLSVFSPTFAQTASTSTAYNSAKQQLISLLTELLSQLESELQTLLANEASNATSSVPVISKPVILSINPSTFNDDSEIQIKGTGFSPTDTLQIALFPTEPISVTSLDGQTIQVNISTNVGQSMKNLISQNNTKPYGSQLTSMMESSMEKIFDSPSQNTAYLNTSISVTNQFGQSNQVPVSINIFPTQ